jgi:hypothetical protein
MASADWAVEEHPWGRELIAGGLENGDTFGVYLRAQFHFKVAAARSNSFKTAHGVCSIFV